MQERKNRVMSDREMTEGGSEMFSVSEITVFSMTLSQAAAVFFLSLFLTEASELVFGIAVGLKRQDLYLIFLVNIITNPPAVFFFYFMMYYLSPELFFVRHDVVLILTEAAVVLTEAWFFDRYAVSVRRPLVFSFIINLFSVLSGVVIQKMSSMILLSVGTGL